MVGRRFAPFPEEKGEKLDHIARQLGQAGLLIKLEPGHQLPQAAELTAVLVLQAAAAVYQAVEQRGPHGAKMVVIVGVTEEIEQDGMEEGERGIVADFLMVEQPEALVQH